jgi:hypothetical protein
MYNKVGQSGPYTGLMGLGKNHIAVGPLVYRRSWPLIYTGGSGGYGIPSWKRGVQEVSSVDILDYRSVHRALLDKARGEPVLYKLGCTVKISWRHQDAKPRHRCNESATLTTWLPTHQTSNNYYFFVGER